MDKRLKKILLISCSGLSALFVVTSVTLSLLALDPTQYSIVDQNISNEEIVNRQIVKAFKDIKEEKKISYKLGLEQLNQMLLNTHKEIETGYGNYYVEVNENNNYRFIVETNILFIPSRVIIDTTLEELDESYVFNINYVTTGKFNGGHHLFSIQFEEMFKKIGLSLKLDTKNALITYSKTDLFKDYMNMFVLNKDALYSSVISSIDLSSSLSSLDGDISKCINNASLTDSNIEGVHYANYSSTLDKIASGVNSISLMSLQNKSSDEISRASKEVFSSINDDYQSSPNLTSLVKERILEKDVSEYSGTGYSKEVASFSELELSDLLKKSDIYGKYHYFVHQGEVAYFVIDNIYADIFVNENSEKIITFTFGINVSGVETHAIIETKQVSTFNEFASDYKVNKVYYGEKEASSLLSGTIKGLFKDLVSSLGDGSGISYTPSNSLVTFDYTNLIKDDPELASYYDVFYEHEGLKAMDISSTSIDEVGYIYLNYSR